MRPSPLGAGIVLPLLNLGTEDLLLRTLKDLATIALGMNLNGSVLLQHAPVSHEVGPNLL